MSKQSKPVTQSYKEEKVLSTPAICCAHQFVMPVMQTCIHCTGNRISYQPLFFKSSLTLKPPNESGVIKLKFKQVSTLDLYEPICANVQAPYCKPNKKNIKKQAEINLSGHFLHSYFELTCVEISRGPRRSSLDFCFIKCSPPLHLGDLYYPVKSLEDEQLTVLSFYAGEQNAHVGQTYLPRTNYSNCLDYALFVMSLKGQFKLNKY